ncbi:MAG: PQQ-binding-like beta-propeller repeat protein, partial [Thermoplasmatota archaeon]
MIYKKYVTLCIVIIFVISALGISIADFTDSENTEESEVKTEFTGLKDSAWPSFSRDSKNTGLSPYDTSGNDGTEKWRFKTNDSIRASPSIGNNGTIYFGSVDNNLYAINSNGTEKWSFKTGDNIRSSPAIGDDGTIYFGSNDNNLYALNPDGTEKWNFTTEGFVQSSPTIGEDGTVYFASNDNHLYALNPDGTKKWSFNPIYDCDHSPAIGDDGTIYFGSGLEEPELFAVHPNGTKKWSFDPDFGGTMTSSPTIADDGTIYYGSVDENLYAVNPDGTEKWNFKTGGNVYSSPAIGPDGTIYFGSDDKNLYALNPNGTEKWNFETDWYFRSPPAIGSDGAIYVGCYDHNLYVLDPNGKKKWNFETESHIGVSPAIGKDGTIYIGSFDNNLYAIGEDNGDKWVPYVPHQEQTKINVTTAQNVEAEVMITFPNTGYRINDWGNVSRNGDEFWVDANIERYTGVSIPTVETKKNVYNLGSLSSGSYNFTFKSHNETVNSTQFIVEGYELAINEIEGEGNIFLNDELIEDFPYQEEYTKGTELILRAEPADNYKFDRWIVNQESRENSEINITMNKDIEITAIFIEKEPVDFDVAITEPDDGDLFEKGDNVTIEFVVAKLFEESYEIEIRLVIHDENGDSVEIEGWEKKMENDTLQESHTWSAEDTGDYTITVQIHDPTLDVIYAEDSVEISVKEEDIDTDGDNGISGFTTIMV